MKPERNFTDKIEYVFSSRPKPAQVRLADEVFQLDFEVEEALWFSGRDWHEITWQDWQEHSSAIYFFDPEAFASRFLGLNRAERDVLKEWLLQVCAYAPYRGS